MDEVLKSKVLDSRDLGHPLERGANLKEALQLGDEVARGEHGVPASELQHRVGSKRSWDRPVGPGPAQLHVGRVEWVQTPHEPDAQVQGTPPPLGLRRQYALHIQRWDQEGK